MEETGSEHLINAHMRVSELTYREKVIAVDNVEVRQTNEDMIFNNFKILFYSTYLLECNVSEGK